MRRSRRLTLPAAMLVVAPLLLTGCILAPPVDAEAADCEQLDAVLAAHDEAEAAVPELGDGSTPDEMVAYYDGLVELGTATGDAARDALAIVQDADRMEHLDDVVTASDALESSAEEATVSVESGGEPDPADLPGLAMVDLTIAIGPIQLDVCHYG